MKLEKGCLVRSTAGHDKGCYYICIASSEGYAIVVDGKHKKLSSPKRKNVKHIEVTSCFATEESMLTDKKIRKLLSVYNENGLVSL